MANPSHVFESLGRQHNRADFSCGVQELDVYLQRQARQDAQRNIAAVFVLRDVDSDLIAGYYTLSACSITPENLPDELASRLPRYRSFPAALIGRLAVDSRYQGQALGELLLIDALHRVLAQVFQIATMAVVVDAKGDRARTFYERYGFERFANEPYRLFITMSTIAELFGEE